MNLKIHLRDIPPDHHESALKLLSDVLNDSSFPTEDVECPETGNTISICPSLDSVARDADQMLTEIRHRREK